MVENDLYWFILISLIFKIGYFIWDNIIFILVGFLVGWILGKLDFSKPVLIKDENENNTNSN